MAESDGESGFEQAWRRARECTSISQEEAYLLWREGRFCRDLAGDLGELGVWRGGTAYLLAASCPDKTLHLFDTFSGMPALAEEVDGPRGHKEGDFADTSIEEVRALLRGCRVRLYPEVFPRTAPARERYCLVHLDADLYRTTREGLEYFWPRLVSGGALVFHDYDWAQCPGVRRAIEDFFPGGPPSIEVPHQYQCIIRKTGKDGAG